MEIFDGIISVNLSHSILKIKKILFPNQVILEHKKDLRELDRTRKNIADVDQLHAEVRHLHKLLSERHPHDSETRDITKKYHSARDATAMPTKEVLN